MRGWNSEEIVSYKKKKKIETREKFHKEQQSENIGKEEEKQK